MARTGLNSEVFCVFNVEKNIAIIGGTWYGGEMKKGHFHHDELLVAA